MASFEVFLCALIIYTISTTQNPNPFCPPCRFCTSKNVQDISALTRCLVPVSSAQTSLSTFTSSSPGTSSLSFSYSLPMSTPDETYPTATPSPTKSLRPAETKKDKSELIANEADKIDSAFCGISIPFAFRISTSSQRNNTIKMLAAASPPEKVQMMREGVLIRLCGLITQYSNIDLPSPKVSKNNVLGISTGSLEMAGNGDNGEENGEDTKEAKFIIGGGEERRKMSQETENRGRKTSMGKKKRAGSAESRQNKGIGYGTGSTKSRWNIERAVEQRNMYEGHLIWLLSALIAFLWGDQLTERVSDWEMSEAHKGGERRRSVPMAMLDEMPAHLADESIAAAIVPSAVIPLLGYHLSNDSVLDVSQHMEFYQVLLELCAALAGIPSLLPHIVLPRNDESKSIAKELIPQFRDNLNNYPALVRGISEEDLAFMDFIRKVNDYSEVIIRMARYYERQIPAEKRIKTSYAQRYIARLGAGGNGPLLRRRSLVPTGGTLTPSSASLANITEQSENGVDKGMSHSSSLNGLFGAASANNTVTTRQATARLRSGRQRMMTKQLSTQQITDLSSQSLNEQYRELLRELQMCTYRLLNDAGKPVHGFSFKKELRSINPFSATHKDRTKRIAKELASMHNSLPLNASNAIFVCMDETRCDILKVLVTGPDDTPYENGLFEFDVFFPASYPQQPPKCSFLTTGAGNVRFNPNLYNDGKICLSILGTWEGRPEEKWNPFCSLLQVLISIQGLIFVRQPYFNEPGFEKFQNTPKGEEFSRKYNLHIENATLVYAIYEQWKNGPAYFMDIIKRHFWLKREAVIRQAEKWLQIVAEDIKNSQAQASEIDGMMDGIFATPIVQRQNVRKLIEAFRDMQNPLLAECEEMPPASLS